MFLVKRKHLQEMQDRFGVPIGSKKRGTLSGTKESQLDAERDYINEEFANANDFDKYALDLEYKDGLEDELGGNIRAKSSEDLLDQLGENVFESKDIRHPSMRKGMLAFGPCCQLY
ncbi:hypothetical protein NDU88_004499 [Pleurodeles waltl]|uniref:Uncharacterized protein n=1 Tax=Pleurodeles waltl TaxID=8319 RepID=A0AAV7UFI0_PLEWA|nr:hypothetical protein NDU88_004499 [Pleurodeles waltl]